MSSSHPTTYNDINWLKLWQNDRARKSWTSKGAKDWDKKAPSFSLRTLQSPYVPLFLSRLPLRKSYTVLDIGCGPGTLALPISEHVKSVTAIDYSGKMLDILNEQARQREIGNISTCHCSWEENWRHKGIEPADIAIASRSMNVDDLPMAIDKIQQFSNRYVFITDRISPSPFDPDAFAAIGRDFYSGPDYIYTINMLYKKNIHPCLEVLELDRDVQFATMEEAMESYRWMFKELTPSEETKLTRYITEKTTLSKTGEIILRRSYPPRWAMIWWEKRNFNAQ